MRFDGADDLVRFRVDLRPEPGDDLTSGAMRNFSKFQGMSPDSPLCVGVFGQRPVQG